MSDFVFENVFYFIGAKFAKAKLPESAKSLVQHNHGESDESLVSYPVNVVCVVSNNFPNVYQILPQFSPSHAFYLVNMNISLEICTRNCFICFLKRSHLIKPDSQDTCLSIRVRFSQVSAISLLSWGFTSGETVR